MQKKGIIINGEWLGNNVKINSFFKTICSISPVVMAEFIKIINSIENLERSVTINQFTILDKNSIDISFSNYSMSGIAKLVFRLNNGIPELIDKQISFDKKENEITNITTEETPQFDKIIENNEIAEEYTAPIQDNNNCVTENSINKTTEFVEQTVPDIKDLYNNLSNFEQEIKGLDFSNQLSKIEEIISTKEADIKDLNTIIEKCLTMHENSVKTPQIQFVNPESYIVTTNHIQEEAGTIPQAVSYNSKLIEPDTYIANDIITELESCNDNNLENKQEEVEKETYVVEEVVIQDIEEQEKVEEKILDEEINPLTEECTENIVEALSITTEEFEEEVYNDIIEEKQEQYKIEVDSESINTEVENYSIQEEILECLTDFYSVTEDEQEVVEKSDDLSAIDAILEEIIAIKEEFESFKEEKSNKDETNENTTEPAKTDENIDYDFTFKGFANNYNEYIIEDEDADFRILGYGKRLNASILDTDMFIAGNKLYKWGDTLYLEE